MTSPLVVSKVGIHACGGQLTGYGDFCRSIKASGRKIAVVKVRNDYSAVNDALACWPDALIIGAHDEFNGLNFDLNKFSALASLNPKIKIWEVCNEIAGEWDKQADLYIKLAPTFAQAGIALCMFNAATGQPQYPWLDPRPYEQIARACRFMLDHHYQAYIGLHEYAYGQDYIGRFRSLADYLEARNCLLPIVITEYGYETMPKRDTDFWGLVRGFDPLYMADPRVLGCALYTLGGAGWQGSNYERMLPKLAEYIATVPAPKPPAPPTDPILSFRGTCPASKWDTISNAVIVKGGTIEKLI